jgi:hypothetical protein
MFFQEGGVLSEPQYGLRKGKICFVANNKPDLDLIVQLWSSDHERDPKTLKELGRMSGYPQTAIDAFGKIFKKDEAVESKIRPQILMLSEREKIERLRDEPDLIPFATLFYMSREHFDTELKTVRRWAETIKSITPVLYQSFLYSFKSRDEKIVQEKL